MIERGERIWKRTSGDKLVQKEKKGKEMKSSFVFCSEEEKNVRKRKRKQKGDRCFDLVHLHNDPPPLPS